MFKLKSAIGRISLLSASAILLGTSIFAGQKTEALVLPQPTFYVSPSGDNTTGSSWQHAFSDMNQIRWSSIHPGDQIVIDGGQGNWNSPVNYYHSLVVPAGAPAVSISLSTEPFHNGAARIYAPAGRVIEPGITILSSNPVSINGETAYGLQLANFPVGVMVQRGSVSLSFLQIIGPSTAAGSPPSSATQSSAILTSGSSNVNVSRTAAFNYRYSAVCHGASTLTVQNSWLYNYSWPGAEAVAGGVFNQGGASRVAVNNCVLGPGLNYGVANCSLPGLAAEVAGPSAATTVNNCLLIQPAVQGLATLAEGTMVCTHITEFKTLRNPYCRVGNCVASTTPLMTGMQVRNSIVCGGIVEVPAFAQPLTSYNTQFNTSGNTRFLSGNESDPHFLTVQPCMPNPTNILQWIDMDFSSRRHSTTGEGSTLNSINQLLNSWYYSAVSI